MIFKIFQGESYMKKIFVFAFSVLFAFILAAELQAAEINIDFDNNGLSYAASQGINFSVPGTAEITQATIADNSTNKLKLPQNASIDIVFNAGMYLSSFSFDKWEPDSTNVPGTVYWQLLDYDGTELLDPAGFNPDKNAWKTIVVALGNYCGNIGAIKIWGVTDGEFYLDNMKFELGSSTAIPEPSALLLLGLGLMGLVGVKKKF